MTVTTDERAALRGELYTSAVQLLEGAKTRDRLLHLEASAAFPDDTWRSVVAAGWPLTLVPEDEGGLGLGLVELGAIFTAVGRRLCRGPLYDHLVAVPLLLREAPGALRPLLRGAIDGDAVVVSAEAPARPYGPGAESVTLRGGRIDGVIELVPFAPHADRIAVTAYDGASPTVALVDRAATTVEPMESHDPSIEYGRVRLEGVPVADRVIASGEAAARLRERVRAACRLMAAAEVSGAMGEIVDMSVEYAKVRQQFGRPIGGFQALRHILAAMLERARSLENLVDASLADADADRARIDEIAMIAKAHADRVGRSVAEDGLQAHGGIGFTAEYPLHLYMRRAFTLEGYLGETSDLLAQLGAAALAG